MSRQTLPTMVDEVKPETKNLQFLKVESAKYKFQTVEILVSLDFG